jgi:topoisomerase-4 subunit A
MEKFKPEATTTCLYFDAESGQYFVKRFVFEPTEKITKFITEDTASYIEAISNHHSQKITIKFAKVKGEEPKPEKLNADEFVEVRNIKAKGNKVSNMKVKEIEMIDPFAKVSQEEIEMESEEMSPIEKLKAKSNKKGKSTSQGKLF